MTLRPADGQAPTFFACARARCGSIFCCPRARLDFFRRNDFFDDAFCIVPDDLEDAAVALWRCVVFGEVAFAVVAFDLVVLDAVDFFVVPLEDALWLA